MNLCLILFTIVNPLLYELLSLRLILQTVTISRLVSLNKIECTNCIKSVVYV